jgi:hypothetical protein
MNNKKKPVGRPRKRETIYIQCPDCNKYKTKSKEEYKLKGTVEWDTSNKKDEDNQIINDKIKKSLIVNIIDD